MPGLVLDTHSALWYLELNSRLSSTALQAIRKALDNGERCVVASISLVETTYLTEKGRIRKPLHDQLMAVLQDPASGIVIAPLDLAVVHCLKQIPRDAVPDLPDRVIAATALALELPLVTRDGRIRAAEIETIW